MASVRMAVAPPKLNEETTRKMASTAPTVAQRRWRKPKAGKGIQTLRTGSWAGRPDRMRAYMRSAISIWPREGRLRMDT